MLSERLFETGLPSWALLAEIILAGMVVIFSGARLTRLANRLAVEFDLGGAFVGALLLASVTSLPEVVSSGTAVWIGQTDMAFAAIYGSCSFNIVLIVLFNYFVGGGSILQGLPKFHSLSSSFGIVLMTLSLLGIIFVEKFGDSGAARVCEWAIVVLIAVVYVYCMRLISRVESHDLEPEVEKVREAVARTPGLGPKIFGLSVVLAAAAWWMARTGDVLADHPLAFLNGRSLGATFVGALFLAIATSLPEMATGLAAVKIGRMDMALGNIFGSNMFNIFVIPMLKVVSVGAGQPLLMSGPGFHTTQNMIAGLLPILLTGVVVGGLSYRTRRTVLNRFGVDSALIAAIYGVGMVVLLT